MAIKNIWPVNWTGNLAYIKPAKPGSRTNLNLITASGNVYSFLATEVSNIAGSHADLKVFVNPVDSTALVAMKDKPRFIPAGSVEIYKKQAENAQAQLAAQQAALKKELEQERIEVRAHAAAAIKHDYQYSSAARKNPFNVTGIYHDDRFTYIEAKPEEAPAVYEVKDGKPSLIQFEFDQKTGRYRSTRSWTTDTCGLAKASCGSTGRTADARTSRAKHYSIDTAHARSGEAEAGRSQ